MTLELFLLFIVVVTALAFDFTNGFHDTGNAMASSIATGALKPKAAVALSASLNLVGAFLSIAVAATIAKGLVDAHLVTLELVFAGLVGGIVWNLLTWLLGIPSSSSHALIGGIVGAMIAAVGGHGVIWHGLVSKVILPALLAPTIALIVATVGAWLVYRVTRRVPEKRKLQSFRYGQLGSASLISLAHGTNDAQKTMGVIFLALISYGAASSTDTMPPLWVIVSCAVAIAAGTYLGGWRVIRTMSKGLVEIESPQGMAADTSSATIILLSSHFGYALSTTHVATGSILGSGVGKPGAEVRWAVAGRMVTAWLITLPSCRDRRRDYLLPSPRHRWLRRRGDRLRAADRRRDRDLAEVASGADHPQERHPRVARQPDRRYRKPSATGFRVGRADRRAGSGGHPVSAWFNYAAAIKILVFGLVVGAGLPTLFAMGVRINAEGAGVARHGDAVAQRNPLVLAVSWLIFAVVLVAVTVGVLFIARDFIGHHAGWYILGAKQT